MKVSFIDPQKYDVYELGTAMARTSRDHRGFDAIIESVSHLPVHERSEKIMKFTEYGHASILDLIEMPLSFQGITMYQAARLFQFSPRGAGQEASTRYINSNPEWEAIYQQKRREGRLDEIRGAILNTAPTSVVLRQSLRGWLQVVALCRHSGEDRLEELGISVNIAILKNTSEENKSYIIAYREKLFDQHSKTGEAMFARSQGYFLDTKVESYVDTTNVFSKWIVSITDNLPFTIIRDLNRHRNRISTAWGTPVEGVPMSWPVPYRAIMTLEQFRYEFGVRTTKEADPAYAAAYHRWNDVLEDIL